MEPRSKGEGNKLPAESTDLEFITFTDFNQTTHPETKKRVRSHVMHQVQRNVRSEKRNEKKGEIVLDLSLLSQASALPSQDGSNSMLAPAVVPRPYDLGAGRSDPFVKYPIDMDVRTHESFDHLHGDTCPMFRTMSKIGFFRTVVDEAGFCQILCTSSSHMTRLRDETENAEAIALSTEAIRSISRRLADPTLAISDGVIVTILAFACHAGMLTHFNGLEEIIRRRGGLQTLISTPAIQIVLFWFDVNTAFILDRSPRFPSPDDILPRINLQPLLSLSGPTLLQACLTDNMANAINKLIALNRFMESELTVRNLWDDGVFAGLNVVPALSTLLSIRYEIVECDPAVARQEACRIGAVLYLAGIRCRFGVKLATNVHIPKLKNSIVAQGNSNLEKTDPILLWVLIIGGVQSFMHEEHKWFVSVTANQVIHKYGMWEELMAVVRGVLWIDGILESECNEFQREVATELWTSYRYIFS